MGCSCSIFHKKFGLSLLELLQPFLINFPLSSPLMVYYCLYESMTDFEVPHTLEAKPPTSPDRFGNLKSGSFLVSPQGNETLKLHRIEPQILFGKVDRLREMLDRDGTLQKALDDDMELRPYEAGEYSRLFRLTFHDRDYVVKVPSQKHHTPQAPYTQHMRQKQAISADLGQRLAELNITLPTPLVASDKFYLEEYVQGRLPLLMGEDQIYDALNKARGILTTYLPIAKQQEPDIWDRTGIETIPPYERIHTMRVKPDGSLSWVAPVFNTSLSYGPHA